MIFHIFLHLYSHQLLHGKVYSPDSSNKSWCQIQPDTLLLGRPALWSDYESLHCHLSLCSEERWNQIVRIIRCTFDLTSILDFILSHVPISNLCPSPISIPLMHLERHRSSRRSLHRIQDFHHQRTLCIWASMLTHTPETHKGSSNKKLKM